MTDETFSDFNKLKEILKKYMKKMNYRNSNTAAYRIRHNQYMRLVKVSIFIAKHQGLRFLFGVVKHKIAITTSDTMEYMVKRGKVFDKTDHL